MSKRNSPSSLRGQGMTEYIIIVALIAIAAIGVFQYFGQIVRHQAAAIGSEVSGHRSCSGQADTAARKDKGMGSFDNDDTIKK